MTYLDPASVPRLTTAQPDPVIRGHFATFVDPWDCCHSSILPSDVDTNIPHSGRDRGDCGAYEATRCLLMTLARRLRIRPRSVHYVELFTPGRMPAGWELTATLTAHAPEQGVLQRLGGALTVVSRSDQIPGYQDRWRLLVNDVLVAAHHVSPTAPRQAALVWSYLIDHFPQRDPRGPTRPVPHGVSGRYSQRWAPR